MNPGSHASPEPPRNHTVGPQRLARAAGCSAPEIPRRLVIAPKTAAHHVQHIYTKLGVSTRAAAALFAVEHGLLGDRATGSE
jgi:hypothetical protein